MLEGLAWQDIWAVLILSAGFCILTVGPAYLKFCADKRRENQRRSLGLPPEKRRKSSPIAVAFLLGMFVLMGMVVIPDLLKMQARDKLFSANMTAKQVYTCVRDYADEYEAHGWEAPVTYIGEFAIAEDDLSAYIHDALGSAYPSGWYAVVCEGGKVQYALYSGHPLTVDDLHIPDYNTEYRKVLPPQRRAADAIGYYTHVIPENE